MKTIMRGHAEYGKKGELVSGGSLVFFFEDGKATGLELFRDWYRPGRTELVPGVEIPAIEKDYA